MKVISTLIAVLLVASLGVLALTTHHDINYSRVIPEYVLTPEPSFGFSLVRSVDAVVANVYLLNVTTLTWMTPEQVGIRSQYWNYVLVSIPKNLDTTKHQATVYITGGSNTDAAPNPDPVMTPMSYATRAVAITVMDVPNQPVTFADDPSQASRTEDGIIAYQWAGFLNDTSKPLLVTQTAMVKTAKLALDAAVQFVQQTASYSIDTFTVIGGSKRGWVTLLLGGVDPRVKSIIPAVIPVFNTKKVFETTYNDICYWPPALADYIAAGVTPKIESPEFVTLTKIVDPLNYPRLDSIQKYQIMAMGDEFFTPELNDIDYDAIEGDKYVRYIPNTGHSLAGSDVFQVILTYQLLRLNGVELPKYKFSRTFVAEGVIIKVKVQNGLKPTAVKLWSATNPNGREFRTYIIGSNVWTSVDLQEVKPLEWQVLVRNPATGYTAATVELSFGDLITVPGLTLSPLKITTNAYVTPNTYPCNIAATSN